ncbi:hypothetical protein [Burkholderia ubonensis]|nr:hypothetical protein [Burkholderia ubonensis]
MLRTWFFIALTICVPAIAGIYMSTREPHRPVAPDQRPALIQLGDPKAFLINGPTTRVRRDSFFTSDDALPAQASDDPARIDARRDEAIPHGGHVSITNESGLMFYEVTWASGNGRVQYRQGQDTVEFSNVFSVLGAADGDDAAGIYEWSVQFPWASGHTQTPRALEALTRAGWRRYIDADDPRLTGRWSIKYALPDKCPRDETSVAVDRGHGLYSMDPGYPLDAAESKCIDGGTWVFYKDHVYITVQNLPVTRIDINSEASFYRAYFEPGSEQWKRWREFLPDELKKAQAKRTAREKELRAKGYPIDTAYQPPPFEVELLKEAREGGR